MTSRYKAAIFDMDGTLLDSMTLWRRQNIDFLTDRGLPIPEEIRGRELSFSAHKAATLYAEKYDLHMTWREIVREYEARMDKCYQTCVLQKPNVRPFLEKLRAEGVRMCVATLTPQDIAERALEKQGLLPYFEFVTTGETLGVPKSRPEYFEAVAARMGLSAKECVVFEDALYAVKGAKAAGCRVVGVADAVSAPDRDEIAALSDAFIGDYAEMMDCAV